jgi:hypothetical protein
VSEWPPITEQELLDRLAMDDRQFDEYLQGLLARVPPRAFEAAAFERAIGYPWVRPAGSYLLTDEGVTQLEDLDEDKRERALARYLPQSRGRLPLLAIGSNAAPSTLEIKFAHFPDEDDRAVLALTGRLRDFDVGAAPQPAVYGSMPATLFPSPGTAVSATVLWVTPAQFVQLTWSELSYRIGSLRTRFDVDDGHEGFDEVLVFVSRFGTFSVDGQPVALAAIPASGRSARALTQEQLLDAAAGLAIGPDANAEILVRAIFEEIGEIAPKIVATVRRASVPFESDRWTPFRTPAATSDLPDAHRDGGER